MAQQQKYANSAASQRRPRNWEVLQALEDLPAPSPSVSCGSIFLGSLASTGEIPIILDSGIIAGHEFGPDNSQSSSACLLPVSASSATTESAGTFGPPRKLKIPQSPVLSFNSQLSGESVDSGLVAFGYNTLTNQSSQFLTAEEGYYDKKPGAHSQSTLAACIPPSVSQLSLTRSLAGRIQPSPSQSSWTSPSPSRDTPSRRRLFTQQSSSIASSLSTIIFATGSAPASPTVASSFGTEAQAYASRYRHNMASSDSRSTIGSRVEFPRSASPLEETLSINSPVRLNLSRPSSPAPRLVLDDTEAIVREGPRLRTKSAVTTKSNDSGLSAQTLYTNSTYSAQSTLRTCVANPSCSPEKPLVTRSAPSLSGSLPWLDNMRLQLWIDQEGFRLVRPVFRLFASSRASGDNYQDSDSVSSLTHGSVEFRPIERQGFAFYHGALDPLPILRKLTLENDESHDYISRQATLSIKSNGIYSVSGVEILERGPQSPLSPTSAHYHESLKLNWRFEYVVEDHHTSPTGKLKPGEKALVPLSFSCSPGLLHPTHGKKINVIQVLKKGLVPKLTSAKVKENPLISDESVSGGRRSVLPVTSHRRVYSSAGQVSDTSVERTRHQTDLRPNSQHIALKRSRAMSFSPGPQLKVDAALLDRHILPPSLVEKLINNPEINIVNDART